LESLESSSYQKAESWKDKELRDWTQVGGGSQSRLLREKILKKLGLCRNSSIISNVFVYFKSISFLLPMVCVKKI
jgi:hypothetical protein